MSERDRMLELIEFYCDADARAMRSKEELDKYAPTFEQIFDALSMDNAA